MDKPNKQYTVPIWLSDWTFSDSRGKKHYTYSEVVKGHNKGEIFLNNNIVNKIVRKLTKGRKKHTLKATNLTLRSQHGYGVDDN